MPQHSLASYRRESFALVVTSGSADAQKLTLRLSSLPTPSAASPPCLSSEQTTTTTSRAATRWAKATATRARSVVAVSAPRVVRGPTADAVAQIPTISGLWEKQKRMASKGTAVEPETTGEELSEGAREKQEAMAKANAGKEKPAKAFQVRCDGAVVTTKLIVLQTKGEREVIDPITQQKVVIKDAELKGTRGGAPLVKAEPHADLAFGNEQTTKTRRSSRQRRSTPPTTRSPVPR